MITIRLLHSVHQINNSTYLITSSKCSLLALGTFFRFVYRYSLDKRCLVKQWARVKLSCQKIMSSSFVVLFNHKLCLFESLSNKTQKPFVYTMATIGKKIVKIHTKLSPDVKICTELFIAVENCLSYDKCRLLSAPVNWISQTDLSGYCLVY